MSSTTSLSTAEKGAVDPSPSSTTPRSKNLKSLLPSKLLSNRFCTVTTLTTVLPWILHAIQATLAIIVLGLTAYVIHWWSTHYAELSPSSLNFLLTTSIWTLLLALPAHILLLLLSRRPTASPPTIPIPALVLTTLHHHPAFPFLLDALTALLWLCAFVALAAFLSDRVCFGRVCAAARAAVVMGVLDWLAFCATTFLAAWTLWRTRVGTGAPMRDPPSPPTATTTTTTTATTTAAAEAEAEAESHSA